MGLRTPLVSALMVVSLGAIGCGKHHDGNGAVDGPGSSGPADACTDGLACFQVDCDAKGLPPTTITGKVFAPNGTLPLYGINVYVPQTDPGPLPDGAVCGNCNAQLPGNPIVGAVTDETGSFTLENVPATADVPLVIQSGKWRRELKLPNVAACQTLPLDAVDTTFPKSRTDLTPHTVRVDLPKIAISTGGSDALECLVKKLGIADVEWTTDLDAAPGQVNLFHGNGRASFSTDAGAWHGGQGAFSDSTTLWGTDDKAAAVAKLSHYDIVMLSCEGGQGAGNKSQTAMDALHDYAGIGGRVFLSHWHNIWVGGEKDHADHGEADWEGVGTFNYDAAQPDDNAAEADRTTTTYIDETVPKGKSFATWMVNVAGSTTRDQVVTVNPRFTLESNVTTVSDRRVYAVGDPNSGTDWKKLSSVQDLEFTTPLDQDPAARCGKVVFSDMHVASGSSPNGGGAFPDACATGDLSPQEKALAFIFFDIASCVGQIN